MQWMFVLELMTEGDGPHIQLSAQCLARSHHPVNGSQMGLHLLYCLLFIVSPPELPPPLGVSPQCPAPVSAPGHLPASLPASPSPLPPLLWGRGGGGGGSAPRPEEAAEREPGVPVELQMVWEVGFLLRHSGSVSWTQAGRREWVEQEPPW